jgi:hypothetical protein
MQYVSWSLPLTRGIAAARELIKGAPIHAVSSLLWGEFFIGVGYILAGYLLFRVFEFEARRRGSLETV